AHRAGHRRLHRPSCEPAHRAGGQFGGRGGDCGVGAPGVSFWALKKLEKTESSLPCASYMRSGTNPGLDLDPWRHEMKRALMVSAVSLSAFLAGCGGSDDGPTPQFPQNADIWQALGGDAKAPAAVAKVVDDAATGLLGDPKEAP